MKRPRDMFDTPSSSSPLSKRPAMAPSSPSTALTSTSYAFPKHTACSSPWASSIPHDSPSNPFGLNRDLRALALPRPSGFGKHIVLRLQVVSQVDSRARSRRIPPLGPYRIVQVPLNYSFRLLHMLILFVLASDARLKVPRTRRVFCPPFKPKTHLNVLGESPKKEEGHLFEVFDDVSLYANHYRPGVIKPGSGKLYARLSSARERRLFPDGDEEDEDATLNKASITPLAQLEAEDEEGWDWEGEDDFVLSNVWTDGPDLKKGIIYHHTPSTTIHITVNQTRLFPRKGAGNTPYVFSAIGGTNGAVRIANVASGPAPNDDEKENIVQLLGRAKKKGDAKKTRPFEEHIVWEEVNDLDDGEMAAEEQFERWNHGEVFQRFLKREAERERAMRRHPDTPPSPIPVSKGSSSQRSPRRNILVPASSPGAGPSSRSSYSMHHPDRSRPVPSYKYPYIYAMPHAASSSSSLAPSSPSTLPVPLGMSDVDVDFDESSDAHVSSDAGENTRRPRVYQIELPLETPLPAHPAMRRRLARVTKRMERATSKGLSEFSDSEEEVVTNTKAGKTKAKRAEDDPEWGRGSPSKMPSSRASSRCSERPKGKGKEIVAEDEEDIDVTAKGQQAASRERADEPPVVASEGLGILVGKENGDEPCDEIADDYDDDGDRRLEDDDEDSCDEIWDVGPTWFGPVDDDWDSEDEK